MAARAEAEAAHRWARYAEDMEPDDDDNVPHMEEDQDSDDDDADPQASHAAQQYEITTLANRHMHTYYRLQPCKDASGVWDISLKIIDYCGNQGAGLGWIPGDARRAVADRRLPLQHFLRLMAGARMADRPAIAGTNDDLVSHLRKTGAIKQCVLKSY